MYSQHDNMKKELSQKVLQSAKDVTDKCCSDKTYNLPELNDKVY